MSKWFSWVMVILWMAFIFYLSHQPAATSNELSTGVTEIIVETVEKVMPGKADDSRNWNHIARKNAHFFAYFLLGIMVLFALSRGQGTRRSEAERPNVFISHLDWKKLLLALFICVLYAISDELHQLFVPGRGAQVSDVLLDSAGTLCGLGVYMLVQTVYALWSTNHVKGKV